MAGVAEGGPSIRRSGSCDRAHDGHVRLPVDLGDRLDERGGRAGRQSLAALRRVRLDPQGQRWLAGLLRSRAERGCAVLLSSHDLHEVSRLADRVVMVARGRVLADEPITAASSAELEEQYFTLTSGADRAA